MRKPSSQPTERELEILKVLWERGEASVREVYEDLGQRLGIVQNTVQAFLRGMEDKGLVSHSVRGRTFVYRAVDPRDRTERRLLGGLLERAFDGAVDQLVASALEVRRPNRDELERLRRMLDELEDDPQRGRDDAEGGR